MTGLIGGADNAKGFARGLHGVVEAAKGVAGEAFERLDRTDHRIGLDVQIRRGGAIEIFGRDADFGHFIGDQRGLVGGAQLKGQPFGFEILDQKAGAGQRIGIGVRIEPQRPGAAHGTLDHGQGGEIATSSLIAEQLRAGHHAIGALDFHDQRQAGHGRGAIIAQQGSQEHGFAGAIDAAFGGSEQVERAR